MEDYSINWEVYGPSSVDDNNVVLNKVSQYLQVLPEILLRIRTSVNPLARSNLFGVDLHTAVRDILV